MGMMLHNTLNQLEKVAVKKAVPEQKQEAEVTAEPSAPAEAAPVKQERKPVRRARKSK